MRTFHRIILATISLSALPVSASEAGKLLPNKSGTIEVVSPKFDDKAIAINDKIMQAVVNNRKVLDAHFERHAGEGLVWHEKLGVSRDDLAYMKSKYLAPSFVRTYQGTVKVEKKGDAIHLRLNPYGVPQPALESHLIYDLKTGAMSINQLKLKHHRFNNAVLPMDVGGRYVPGYEWALSGEPSVTGFVHVGRIPNEPGKCLLNLSVIESAEKLGYGSYRYNCP